MTKATSVLVTIVCVRVLCTSFFRVVELALSIDD